MQYTASFSWAFFVHKIFATTPFWARAALAAIAAGVVAWAILASARATTGVAVFWPLNGIFLALCFLVPMRQALVYLGAFFVGSVSGALAAGDPLHIAVALNLYDVLEICIAWIPLRILVQQYRNLGHPAVLAYFTVFGLLLGPIVSGTLAALTLEHYLHVPVWNTIRTWIPSNALGMAVFAPLTLAFRPGAWTKEELLAEGLLGRLFVRSCALIATAALVYLVPQLSFFFILVPPLVWLTFGGGFVGAPLGIFILMLISFPMTNLEMGPASNTAIETTLAEKFFVLQFFLSLMLLVTLPIGMILDHRNRLLKKLKLRESELLFLSEHDPLTGVYNRRGLERLFAVEEARNTPTSFVVLDVDWFKLYNDSYGHPEGDECLRWLSGIIADKAALQQGAVGRMGGEEFGVLLPDTGAPAVVAWATALRDAVVQGARPHSQSPLGVVTISLGVATRTGGGRATDRSLFLEADAALYRAKQQGRNQVGVCEDTRGES